MVSVCFVEGDILFELVCIMVLETELVFCSWRLKKYVQRGFRLKEMKLGRFSGVILAGNGVGAEY